MSTFTTSKFREIPSSVSKRNQELQAIRDLTLTPLSSEQQPMERNSYVPQLLAPLHNIDAEDNFMELKYEMDFPIPQEVKSRERCSATCVSGPRKHLRCKKQALSGKDCCSIHMKYHSKRVRFSLPPKDTCECEDVEFVEVKDAETQTDDSDSSEEEIISTNEDELWIDSAPSYIA